MLETVLISTAATQALTLTPAAQSFSQHIGTWCAGIAASIALPFVIKYLFGKGLDAAIAWQMGKLVGILDKKTGDVDVDAFVHDLTISICKLAEKKLPGAGLGADRKKMVIDFLTNRFPLLKGQEQRLSEGIDLAVAKEREMLTKITLDKTVPGL